MVEVRQLRIGSHVEYEGKRVCVDEIRTQRPEGSPIRLLVSYNGLFYGNPSIEDIEPIAITPELLAELGFEDKSLAKWYSPSWVKEDDDCFVAFEKKPGKEAWKVFCVKDNVGSGFCVCRYLHQAESFLALHNVELIDG